MVLPRERAFHTCGDQGRGVPRHRPWDATQTVNRKLAAKRGCPKVLRVWQDRRCQMSTDNSLLQTPDALGEYCVLTTIQTLYCECIIATPCRIHRVRQEFSLYTVDSIRFEYCANPMECCTSAQELSIMLTPWNKIAHILMQ